MKSILLTLAIVSVLAIQVNAQDRSVQSSVSGASEHKSHKAKFKNKHQFAAGLTHVESIISVSLKFAFSQRTVAQAVLTPLSPTIGAPTFNGVRLVYRFLATDNPTVAFPYVYVGGGLLGWSAPDARLWSEVVSGSSPTYYVGGGYELIIERHLALSGEVGYGRLRVNSEPDYYAKTTKVSLSHEFMYGGGVHYYFGLPKKKKVHVQDERIETDDEDDTELNRRNKAKTEKNSSDEE
jgi:hypothetical protein